MNSGWGMDLCELCSKPIYSGDGSYGACNECVKIHISNAIKDKKSYESIHLRHKRERGET